MWHFVDPFGPYPPYCDIYIIWIELKEQVLLNGQKEQVCQ